MSCLLGIIQTPVLHLIWQFTKVPPFINYLLHLTVLEALFERCHYEKPSGKKNVFSKWPGPPSALFLDSFKELFKNQILY